MFQMHLCFCSISVVLEPSSEAPIQVGMAAQKGTVERLRQSGVGAWSNAFAMAAFLESKQNLLCDHPSLFIKCHYIYIHVIIFIDIDNQIDIIYIYIYPCI